MDTTCQIKAINIRKNYYVILNDRPCKIMDIKRVGPGISRTLKICLYGIDIFNEEKISIIVNDDKFLQMFNPIIKEYILIDIENDFAVLLDNISGIIHNVKMNSYNLFSGIINRMEKTELIVTTLSALGREEIISFDQN